MIRVLPPEVADAIAAGEVVERPASVVKELIENALDAGARRIAIEVRGAGRNLVRVADDGTGIPPDELTLAFQRHATSKLARIGDLEAIATLGFRGEALASIAAVADVECSSGGRRVHLRGGTLLEEGVAPPLAGTIMEIRDLFANTPARLRFLKSEATEAAACVRSVESYALLHPEVRFTLLLEGREVLETEGDGRLESALAAVYGGAVAAQMLRVESLGVTGAVSQPRLSRGNRDAVLLAVNGRPVASRALAFALEECYRGALERGRYPVAVLDLAVPPERVDVNVHPAKREVRFHSEGAVFTELQRAVLAALQGSEVPRLTPAAAGESQPAERILRLSEPPAPIRYEAPVRPAGAGLLRPLGQVMDGYLVAEGPEGVVLIDQHAAHERILYNRFRARLEGSPGVSQPLLLPLVVELDAGHVASLDEHRSELASLGFEVEVFGPRAVRILAGPVETPPERLEDGFAEVLAGLAGRYQDDALAGLACHSAVRFGDRLEPAEQRRLIEELETTTPDATCPHGRPTRLVVEWQELKRHFRRNY